MPILKSAFSISNSTKEFPFWNQLWHQRSNSLQKRISWYQFSNYNHLQGSRACGFLFTFNTPAYSSEFREFVCDKSRDTSCVSPKWKLLMNPWKVLLPLRLKEKQIPKRGQYELGPSAPKRYLLLLQGTCPSESYQERQMFLPFLLQRLPHARENFILNFHCN